MANPNNALGTNSAFGGRTSVNAFNDVLGAFSGRGIISGWSCSPSSGLTVTLGGNGTARDVAIAEDSAGNKTTVNNLSESPISVTMDSAPASNTRIDSIIAYIESSPQGNATTDNPEVVNLLVVDGTASSTPTAPDDSAIRTAITADGASGTTAYYVVLANITITTGTTDISSNMIASGGNAKLASDNVPPVTADMIDFTTLGGNYSTTEQDTGFTWINGEHIYKKTVNFGALPDTTGKSVAHNITGLDWVIEFSGVTYNPSINTYLTLPCASASSYPISLAVSNTNVDVTTTNDRSGYTQSYITLYYTKTS